VDVTGSVSVASGACGRRVGVSRAARAAEAVPRGVGDGAARAGAGGYGRVSGERERKREHRRS
jgi:hypothetical protein